LCPFILFTKHVFSFRPTSTADLQTTVAKKKKELSFLLEVRCYIKSSAFFSSTLTLAYQFDVPRKW